MPSDLNPKSSSGSSGLGAGFVAPEQIGKLVPPPEPPSVKLIVRLFVIPLLIVVAIGAVVIPVGMLAGNRKSLDAALRGLQNPGGERTGGILVGPAAKERYLDAKTIVDHLHDTNLSPPERIKLGNQLVDILNQWSSYKEGDVQHALLFALSLTYMHRSDPAKPGQYLADTDATTTQDAFDQGQKKAMDCLLQFAEHENTRVRKAALLSLSYWKGREEAERAIPVLIAKLQKPGEDLDVKMSAATALGPIGNANDKHVTEALGEAMRNTDPHEAELVWDAAVSLAQLNRPESTDIMLRLLSRNDLNEMMVYDRETDPSNPIMRKLNDLEKERFIINALIAAQFLKVDAVQQAMEKVAKDDPSDRVKQAAAEVLGQMKKK